tara:strand:- start:373 stop:609 length:237 start_codon:yes stop_codon:yes gene_type:complete
MKRKFHKIRVNAGDKLQTVWATDFQVEAESITFLQCKKDGCVWFNGNQKRLFVVHPEDLIWVKDAVMNLTFGELEMEN